jgi:hypothetical protein
LKSPRPARSSHNGRRETVHAIVKMPSQEDVLLGRGRPFQTNSGNQRMLRLVHDNKARYDNTKREQRRMIAEKVLDLVCKSGSQFLRRVDDTCYWETVPRAVASDKVDNALRNKKKRNREKKCRSSTRIRETGDSTHFITKRRAREVSLLNAAAYMPPAIPSPSYLSYHPLPSFGLVL